MNQIKCLIIVSLGLSAVMFNMHAAFKNALFSQVGVGAVLMVHGIIDECFENKIDCVKAIDKHNHSKDMPVKDEFEEKSK